MAAEAEQWPAHSPSQTRPASPAAVVAPVKTPPSLLPHPGPPQEYTNYHFDVAPAHLQGALDRLAQFFVKPLFLVRRGTRAGERCAVCIMTWGCSSCRAHCCVRLSCHSLGEGSYGKVVGVVCKKESTQ